MNADKQKQEAGKEGKELSEAPEITLLTETDDKASEKWKKKSKQKRESCPEPVDELLNVKEEDTNATQKKKAKKKKKRNRSLLSANTKMKSSQSVSASSRKLLRLWLKWMKRSHHERNSRQRKRPR